MIGLKSCMRRDRKGKPAFYASILILLFTVAFAGSIFVTLCRTEQVDEYLGDTSSHSWGWRYEVLSGNSVREVTPDYVDEYTQIFPVELLSAVKITRTMTEALPEAELEIAPYLSGTEVFLDDTLLYSDFPGAARGENGYLMLTDADFADRLLSGGIREVRFTLPADYTGRELSIVTYFPASSGFRSPAFPMLGNYKTAVSPLVVETVAPVAVLTVCALAALLLAVLFLMSAHAGQADWTLLPLAAFYLVLFLNRAALSLPGFYSGLDDGQGFAVLEWLYTAPLCVCLALKLTRWRRIALLFGVAAQLAADGGLLLYNVRHGFHPAAEQRGIAVFALLVLTILLTAEESRKTPETLKRYINWKYVLLILAALLSMSLIQATEWDGLPGYFSAVFSAARHGNFLPLTRLLSTTFATVTTLILVAEFVRRTLETRQMVDVLQTRSDMAMESYRLMRAAADKTRAAQHELRHHTLALAGLLEQGHSGKAMEYLSNLENAVDQLPAARYSDNLLVNTIAGSYIEQARRLGIQVEYSLSLPEHPGIDDADLCVLLTNLLENAVDACCALQEEQARYIRLQMHTDGQFFLVACRNSAAVRVTPDGKGRYRTTKTDGETHGYGIAAMSAVAEKYNSNLKIDSTDDSFTVKTNLLLKGW